MNFLPRFSHIYVEEELLDHPDTARIRALFPRSHVIAIRRYTDVFNRKNQSFQAQFRSQGLILAKKHGTLLYPGSPVCHDFGTDRFFYTATALNCMYSCDYCWLKGIYGSAVITVFLNLEDYFQACEEQLNKGGLFLSLSYESDLFPLEEISGHLHRWSAFARSHETLLAEVRTKSSRTDLLPLFKDHKNFIAAWTLSPQPVITACEHFTPSLESRIRAVNTALAMGCTVRLCLDPVLRIPDWKTVYADFLARLAEAVDLSLVRDISIGSYRQSEEYQKRMRRRFPELAAAQYPYVSEGGFARYKEHRDMDAWMRERLAQYVSEEKIFSLKEDL